jgi:hypothetical protein
MHAAQLFIETYKSNKDENKIFMLKLNGKTQNSIFKPIRPLNTTELRPRFPGYEAPGPDIPEFSRLAACA